MPISTLIAGYESYKSGYRKKYRALLRRRFRFVDWKEQLDILEAFARSTSSTDIKWIQNILKSDYRSSLNIIEAIYDRPRVQNLINKINHNTTI